MQNLVGHTARVGALQSPPPPSRAPLRGLQLMAIIVVVLGLVALYANWQRFQRERIETVIVSRPPTPAPEASAAQP
ncbi:MAG: hypothetical protein ABI795_00495 [Chthoniobacterales bacterium]|nr:hypothetical protein [Chthoniobacterales bacterium]